MSDTEEEEVVSLVEEELENRKLTSCEVRSTNRVFVSVLVVPFHRGKSVDARSLWSTREWFDTVVAAAAAASSVTVHGWYKVAVVIHFAFAQGRSVPTQDRPPPTRRRLATLVWLAG